MTDKAVFDDLVVRAMAVDGFSHMRPVIEKELLHHDILFILDKKNLLDRLTFQGGTALRLCYGAQRLSEDLDFAGGVAFVKNDLLQMKNCLEEYLGERYGLTVSVKEPKTAEILAEKKDIVVNRWQLNVITAPDRKDLPTQKIRIEIVNIPAYSREPRALQNHYDFLPDGYNDTLIMTESMEEIMADKIVSLVSCTRYIRYRDLWDLRWLKQQNVSTNVDYVRKKINDYGEKHYVSKLDHFSKNLRDIIFSKFFYDELSRFVPLGVQERTLKKEKFLSFLYTEIHTLLQGVKLMLTKI